MAENECVFLFDVDNTLLNNDRVQDDLRSDLEREVGHERQERYWAFFEQLRSELGYADYLGALQRYRAEYPRDFRILRVSSFLLNYPFATRLFPGALEAIDRFKPSAPAVLLSDGDVVFQPFKIERSGLGDAVDHAVLIYIHKELELDDVESRYPARHYVMFDDKIRILTAMKQIWRERLTTVFVRQGHYATDLAETSKYPPADVAIEKIEAALNLDPATLISAARAS